MNSELFWTQCREPKRPCLVLIRYVSMSFVSLKSSSWLGQFARSKYKPTKTSNPPPLETLIWRNIWSQSCIEKYFCKVAPATKHWFYSICTSYPVIHKVTRSHFLVLLFLNLTQIYCSYSLKWVTKVWYLSFWDRF